MTAARFLLWTVNEDQESRTMARIDSDSSLRVYLREITQTELLTAAEEIALAARIKAGDERARANAV